MRNLDQRMEEIRQRSEKILCARKRRKKAILSLCIPLVAVVGLLTVLARPTGLTHPTPATAQTNGETGAAMDYENTSRTCSIARIQVSGNGHSLTHTDTDRILDIWGQLTAMQNSDKLFSYATAEDVNGSPPSNTQKVNHSQSGVYRLVLTLHEGGSREYYLTPDGLECPHENKIYAVTDSQRSQLLALLGIDG